MSLKTFFVGHHNLFVVLIDPGEMSQKKNTINDSRELNGLVLDRSVLHLRQWFAVLGEEHCDVSWY